MGLLSFHGLTEEQQQWLYRFIGSIGVINLDDNVKDKAIELRKNHRMKLPDAIIAASAIENGLELVSRDKGMDSIPGLRIHPIDLVT